MNLKLIKSLPWLIFLFHVALSVSTNHPSDPSTLDETDLSIIDDFLKSAASTNKPDSNPNPSRGSLPEPGKETAAPSAIPTTGSPLPPVPPGLHDQEGQCKCVKYYLCEVGAESGQNQTLPNPTGPPAHNNQTGSGSDNGTSIEQDIFGIVDVRKAELKNMEGNSTVLNAGNGTSQCESYFDVCCPPTRIKPSSNGTQVQNLGQEGMNGQKDKPVPLPTDNQDGHHTRCGQQNEKGVGFTMTGDTQGEAQFGEFPWTVAVVQLEKVEDSPNVTIHKYVGGGSLLHPRVVLTVAHNVLGKSRTTLKVRLGEWDTQTNDEPYPSQDRQVKKVIIHEQFVLKTLFNDLALLILDEEARFAPNVDTVCLPPVNKTLDFEGQMCYSAGWGKDHFGAEGRYSEILKRVSVPIVSKDKCQKELSKSEKLPGFRLDKSFMCAGGSESGDDTCKGDGGSALVCAVSDKAQHTRYVQVGAVSWGLGCGSTQYPAVYSDVTLMTPWILKQLEKEGISSEYCTIHD